MNANDAEFFFLNHAYLNAYIQLLKSVRQHGGLFLLTGEPGVGKTFLLRKLESAAPDNIKFISLFSGDPDYEQLIKTLCDRVGINEIEPYRPTDNAALRAYVKQEDAEQRSSVVLLIDNAHKLGERGLAHLIALFDWTLPDPRSPRIVLGGAPELEATVDRIGADQMIAARRLHVRLEPLAENDVAAYIARQLNTGATPEMNPLFSRWAIQKITRLTGGVPDLINTLCKRALAITRGKGKTTVSMLSIDQAAKEMMLEAEENSADGVTLIPWAKHYAPDSPQPADANAVGPAEPERALIGEEPDAIVGAAPPAVGAAPSAETIAAKRREKSKGFALDNADDYPVTMVSFAKPDPEDTRATAYSLAPVNQELYRRHENAGYQMLDRLMEDDLLANATISMQWDERYAQQNPPKTFSSPTVQFIALILVSILAGIAGGIGSYYLFDSKPVQISVVAPAGTALALDAKPAVETGGAALARPAEPVQSRPAAATGAEQGERAASAPPAKTATSATAVAQSSGATAVAAKSPLPPATAPALVATPLMASYMSKGDAFMARGDVASARSFYLEAANIGLPAAMAAVGKTYDPIVLSGLQVKGFSPDPVKAIEWYSKAERAGSAESAASLDAIRQLMADGSYPARASAAADR
ncbi:MAG: AAA family ATPase [Candidatus Competibacteraceae bacterium]|nr:AAA family ATPase [Candidatus Competibacteraceae bacterium]